MPRRGQIAKRDVLPDPLYNSKLVTRLINSVMYDGKKGVAQKIVYDAFDIIAEKTGKEPLEVFDAAMENVMPVLEVKARRVGGATYQVPMEVRPERRQTLGLRWITLYARQRSERTMKERLANEIMDAVNSQGSAFKKREDTHKMAELFILVIVLLCPIIIAPCCMYSDTRSRDFRVAEIFIFSIYSKALAEINSATCSKSSR